MKRLDVLCAGDVSEAQANQSGHLTVTRKLLRDRSNEAKLGVVLAEGAELDTGTVSGNPEHGATRDVPRAAPSCGWRRI